MLILCNTESRAKTMTENAGNADYPNDADKTSDEPNPSPDIVPDTQELRLSQTQMLVGTVRHAETGAYSVFLSLDGNDVRHIAAHWNEERATAVREEVQNACLRLLERSLQAQQTRNAEQTAEDATSKSPWRESAVLEWESLLSRWEAESDAPLLPFPDTQLAVIGEGIQDAIRQRRSLPTLAPGSGRVTVFAPGATPDSQTRPLNPMPLMPSRSSTRSRKNKRKQ
jgi:hypothetical protein